MLIAILRLILSTFITRHFPKFEFLQDVVVVVLVVHERQHCWYEDDLMYLPTWPSDVTRRCRPRPRPRRDCCSAWRLRHLLRAENTGFKKYLHSRSMCGEGGGQIPPRKFTPKCMSYVNMKLGTGRFGGHCHRAATGLHRGVLLPRRTAERLRREHALRSAAPSSPVACGTH